MKNILQNVFKKSQVSVRPFLLQDTFSYGDVFLRIPVCLTTDVLLQRRFDEETFYAETFCMCAFNYGTWLIRFFLPFFT
jgi:hypothetical protein